MATATDIEFIESASSQNPFHVTDELVYEVEHLLKVELPLAYVSLMKRHNGGYIPQHLLRVEDSIPTSIRHYLEDGFVSVGRIAGISTDTHSVLSIASTIYLVEEWDLPKGLVLLDGDGHTWIALDYGQAESNPPVVFVVSDNGHQINIASDFADFLARLVPYEVVYDTDGNLKANSYLYWLRRRADQEILNEALCYALDDEDPFIRMDAAWNVCQSEEPNPDIVEPLIRALKSSQDMPIAFSMILNALGKLRDQRAFEPIVAHLESASGYQRGAAAQALGKLGDQRAIEYLTALMDDQALAWKEDHGPERSVAYIAREALKRLRGEKMLPETHRDLTLPHLHPALELYRAALQEVMKPAWLLKCSEADTVSRFQTHIGGITPFAPVEDGWPMCDKCGKPLEFIWQIDFADFKGIGAFASQGLFQFFYCWDCFAWPPHEEYGYACRWYPDFSAHRMRNVAQIDTPPQIAESVRSFGPFCVDIVPFLSVPGKSSPENPISKSAQNEMVSEEDGRLWAVYSFTEGFYLESELISRIGGYPPWIQYEDDTPHCPVCDARAEFVGAIGSADTGLIWGDSGYWYFFACQATAECYGLARPLMTLHCY